MDSYKRRNYNLFLTLIGCIVIAIVYVEKVHEIITRVGYQWEVREGAVFALAKCFADGSNPYMLSDLLPNPVYMYGIVLPVIVRIAMVFGIKGCIIVCEGMTLLTEICGVLLFGKIMQRKKIWGPLIPIGMLFFCSCYFRTSPFSGVFPDTYGITLSVLVWYIVVTPMSKRKIKNFLIVSLCILLFFIKLYFACIAIGIVLYYVFKNELSNAVSIAISGTLIGVILIVLTRIFFPAYFTYNIYYLSKYSALVIDNTKSQIIDIFKIYRICIFAIIFELLLSLKRGFINLNKCVYEIIQGIILFIVSCFLGMNGGAYLQYFFQLFIPYLICISVYICSEWHKSVQATMVMHKTFTRVIDTLVILFYVAATISSVWNYIYVKPIKVSEKKQWNDVYALLNEFDHDEMKVYSLPLNFYCLYNGIFDDNPGHSNCYKKERLLDIRNDPPNELFFPYVEESTKQYLDYMEDTLDKCEKGYYKCVLVDVNNDFSNLFESALTSHYELFNTYELVCGYETWEVMAYLKK